MTQNKTLKPPTVNQLTEELLEIATGKQLPKRIYLHGETLVKTERIHEIETAMNSSPDDLCHVLRKQVKFHPDNLEKHKKLGHLIADLPTTCRKKLFDEMLEEIRHAISIITHLIDQGLTIVIAKDDYFRNTPFDFGISPDGKYHPIPIEKREFILEKHLLQLEPRLIYQ